MPRWPGGLHLQSGALPALGAVARRIPVTPQRQYWRQAQTALFAGGGPVTARFNAPGLEISRVSASAGPQGVGERWMVELVQVQASILYGSAPLVAQQISAQITGTMTTPPPPVVAQAWLSAGGVNVHLLAQTSQGGNDDLSVSCPVLTPGEAVTVVWFGLPASEHAWFTLRGTKLTLDAA